MQGNVAAEKQHLNTPFQSDRLANRQRGSPAVLPGRGRAHVGTLETHTCSPGSAHPGHSQPQQQEPGPGPVRTQALGRWRKVEVPPRLLCSAQCERCGQSTGSVRERGGPYSPCLASDDELNPAAGTGDGVQPAAAPGEDDVWPVPLTQERWYRAQGPCPVAQHRRGPLPSPRTTAAPSRLRLYFALR